MNDLRPISLCNVLYKIVSKVLANRLKRVLLNCISKEQPTFIEGRSILDNVLVAIETIHHMKCKVIGNEGGFALKIHINKAFDKVDGRYLKASLHKMGFHRKWVSWMMCVNSVEFHLLVDGEVLDLSYQARERTETRGPIVLLPLYFMYGEPYFTYQKIWEKGRSSWHQSVYGSSFPLAYFFFADICFLFCRA